MQNPETDGDNDDANKREAVIARFSAPSVAQLVEKQQD
jgi:hypothetical protein